MTEETRLDKKSWSGNKIGVIRKYLASEGRFYLESGEKEK